MKHALRLMSAVLIVCGLLIIPTFAQEAQQGLQVGDRAPDFTLPGTDGKTYSLSQLSGKTVVLAWFPKAFTAG